MATHILSEGYYNIIDIIKCENEKCPLKLKCYRYTSKPSIYNQSYSDFTYIDGKCDYFWDNKNE